MPSLLAVAAVAHPGGGETTLLRLLPRLRQLGWDVTLTTPADGLVREAGAAAGISTTRLAVGGLSRRRGGRAVADWPKARRLADRHDVVYLNGTICGRLLPACAGRARTVLHVHDLVERVARLWRRADVVLAPVQAAADRLAGLDAQVVGCPIDPDPPAVAPPWPAGEAPVVGYVGRLEAIKGVRDLLAAAPRLRAAGARVVLVGDDPYARDPATAALARATDGVECYGWVAGAAGFMDALDVLVLPSHHEAFGTVTAEAMNAGTPVVATRVGGLPETVADGVTGRLVAPHDPDALAAAVLEVLAAKERMGAASRERARRWHTDAYADRVAELIAP